ncbi:PDR/VanB family oxidoreductase [Amycolatopsis sp. FDAARGOS 1241]|uniref:PDR/VanB family oxidoreductase n=1 Tax=Amycolatopsis sp. FDAARGOS 1241 TaxID=2778070 RepID=UPI0019516E7E|nr:PDR/VanB family oxidoreductase [Amycolatopsis sp. FDAARGOS 1241]QRP50655.1 oxidoreductase [Amycolatopsis sp. FDAARGOS 1241]
MTDSALRVTRVTWEAEGVVGLRLSSPDGSPLPEWAPGAHLDLKLPSGLGRQYSLCGDPAERRHYDVAVRLETDGRGGSAEIHGTALVGKTLVVNHVRNHFPLDTADSYLLIAGGIGVTPLVPMARELAARGADWSAVYCGHGADTMAFREELTRVGGDRVSFVDTAVAPRPDLKELIGSLAPGAVVYCCGPAGLLDAVTEICEAAGVRCETEHFSAATPDPDTAPGDEVELELRESGITVVADADTTLLQAIRDAGIDVESDCEEGYCGTCETRVLEGTPDHRDVVLSKAERAAGKTFFPCVSRACGRKLVLDL